MDDEWKTPWEQIVKIHFCTKRLTLHAEELEFLEHATYLQPIREERDAFEHICRAAVSQLGWGKHPNDKTYIASSFEAARKHAVRAFFDAADWYGCVLRAGIRERLERYSPQCIRIALPDYYRQIQLRIDEIVESIIQCRQEKDASDEAGTYQEVVVYGNMLEELEGFYKTVCQSAPSLEEVQRKLQAEKDAKEEEEQEARQRERPWSLLISVIAGLIVAGLVAVGGYLLGRQHEAQNQNVPDNPAPSHQGGAEH